MMEVDGSNALTVIPRFLVVISQRQQQDSTGEEARI
jgi:hypothetical protein